MTDLNDLYYFVQVVEHGGFTAAGRALQIPKSKLSRRIAALEQQYDVRLLQRSTRHFSVTETGQEFFEHCRATLEQARAAQEVLERSQSSPKGTIRISCPTALLHYCMGELIAKFLVQCPAIRIHLEATNRQVDVLEERFDLALRVRFPPFEDSDLVMRVLGESPQKLVASHDFLQHHSLPRHPADLAGLDSLGWGPASDHIWHLIGPQGEQAKTMHQPRYITDDLTALRSAAIAGVGIVQLPHMVIESDLRNGSLIELLPGWAPQAGIIHAVFASRRGLLPAVRLFIDYLAENTRAS